VTVRFGLLLVPPKFIHAKTCSDLSEFQMRQFITNQLVALKEKAAPTKVC
jgi:hypothetical protein